MTKQMGDVEITVKGMGGLINFEVAYIAKCFQDLGLNVVVDNPHAGWTGDGQPQAADWLERNIENMKNKQGYKPTVHLKAQHLPWGG